MTIKKANTHHNLACALQGGGALGAYQVGVLRALHEAGYDPNWYVGTSIGAINSAIAAGNPPKERFDKMEKFWNDIATPQWLENILLAEETLFRKYSHFLSSQTALFFGQTNFFNPRFPSPWFQWQHTPDFLSYYDTAPLRQTLERVVDFDRINSKETRLSLGAVEISSGEMHYFDSLKDTIRPEHVMASGALPPGFPAVEIEGLYYWDGGISSNSPISYILEDGGFDKLLCFMIHLFDSYGMQPNNMDEVCKRKKDIVYSSRFSKIIQLYQKVHALKYSIHTLSQHIPEEKKKKDHLVKVCSERGWNKTVNLVRFLYRADESELSSKDYEFSQKSIQERISKGYEDGIASIKKSPWKKPIPETLGIAIHDMAYTE